MTVKWMLRLECLGVIVGGIVVYVMSGGSLPVFIEAAIA